MKTLSILLLSLFLLVSKTQAQNFVGWDGDCTVYFRPGYGYYEYCDGVPDFLGYSWGSWGWRYGWHRNWNGGNWNGGPRRNWRNGNWGNQWNGHGNWHGNTGMRGGAGGGVHMGGGHPAGAHAGGHGHGGHGH